MPRTHGWALLALVVLGSHAAAEPRRRPQQTRIAHRAASAQPMLGPALAPVTLEYFLDPGEHGGERLYHDLERLAARHPSRLRIIYRLESHAASRAALAEAAVEAAAQGHFAAFLEAAWQRPVHTDEAIAAVAAKVGIDERELRRAWKTRRHAATLEDNARWRRRRRVQQRPGLLFNGVEPLVRPRAMNLEQLEAAYDEAYGRAAAALAEGIPLAQLYPVLLARVDDAYDPGPLPIGLIEGSSNRNGHLPAPLAPLMRELPAPGPEPHRGADDARVRIQFFCNLVSTYCARQSASLTQLVDVFAGEVQVVFLPIATGEPDTDALGRQLAEALWCAGERGHYWEFYDRAFELRRAHQRRRMSARERVEDISAGLGLEGDVLWSCVAAGTYTRTVQRTMRAAARAGIDAAPSVLLASRLHVGTKPLEGLIALVLRELEPGLLEQWLPSWLPESLRGARPTQ